MAEKTVRVDDAFVFPELLIFEYLSNGATIDAVGNYSGGVERFEFVNTAQRLAHIARMIVYIEDVGVFPSDKYGKDVVLTNGVDIDVENSSQVQIKDLSSSNGNGNVFTNAGWAELCYDVDYHTYGTGASTFSLAVRWTFRNSGKSVTLRPGDSIVARLEDDFTGLEAHRFMVQGYYA